MRMLPEDQAEYLVQVFGDEETAIKCVDEIMNEIKVWCKQPAYWIQVKGCLSINKKKKQLK